MTPAVGGHRFVDRADAGRQLAAALGPVLAAFPAPGTILIGLPRGGVLVAAAAAAELGLPMDVLAVRKVGSPRNPELALGAVTAAVSAPLCTVLVNQQVVRAEELTEVEVESRVAQARDRAVADDARYRPGRPALDVRGRQVVVVDDGAATGATVRAAARAVRAAGAARVVVALPVAPRDTLAVLEQESDAVVCLRCPLLFRAVGWAYEDFAPPDTDAVVALVAGTS
jgi:putative phosphoribosyl transferase